MHRALILNPLSASAEQALAIWYDTPVARQRGTGAVGWCWEGSGEGVQLRSVVWHAPTDARARHSGLAGQLGGLAHASVDVGCVVCRSARCVYRQYDVHACAEHECTVSRPLARRTLCFDRVSQR